MKIIELKMQARDGILNEQGQVNSVQIIKEILKRKKMCEVMGKNKVQNTVNIFYRRKTNIFKYVTKVQYMAMDMGFIPQDVWDEFIKEVSGVQLTYADKNAVIKYEVKILQGKTLTNKDINELVRIMFDGNRAAYAVLMRYWKIRSLNKFIPNYFKNHSGKSKKLIKADDISILKFLNKKLDRFLRKGLLDFNIEGIGGGIFVSRIKWDIADAVREIGGDRRRQSPDVLIGQDIEFADGKVKSFDPADHGVSIDSVKRKFLFDLIKEYSLKIKEKLRDRNSNILLDWYSIDENGLFTGVYSTVYDVGNMNGCGGSNVSLVNAGFLKWVKMEKGILIERKNVGKEIIISTINAKAAENDFAMSSERDRSEDDLIIEALDNAVPEGFKDSFRENELEEFRQRFASRLQLEHESRLNSGKEGVLDVKGQVKDLRSLEDVIILQFLFKKINGSSLMRLYNIFRFAKLKLPSNLPITKFIAYYLGFVNREVMIEYLNRKKPKTDLTKDQKERAKQLIEYNLDLENRKRIGLGQDAILNEQGRLFDLEQFKEIISTVYYIKSGGVNGLRQISGWIDKIRSGMKNIEYYRLLVYRLGFVTEAVWQEYLDSKKPRMDLKESQKQEAKILFSYYLNFHDQQRISKGLGSMLNEQGQINNVDHIKEYLFQVKFIEYVSERIFFKLLYWFKAAHMIPDKGTTYVQFMAMKLGFISTEAWEKHIREISGIEFSFNDKELVSEYDNKINNNELFINEDIQELVRGMYSGNEAAYEVLMRYWKIQILEKYFPKFKKSKRQRNNRLINFDDNLMLEYLNHAFDRFLRVHLKRFDADEIGYGLFVKRINWDISSYIRTLGGGRGKNSSNVFIEQDRISGNGEIIAFDPEDRRGSVEDEKRKLVYEFVKEYVPKSNLRNKERDLKILLMVYGIDNDGLLYDTNFSQKDIAIEFELNKSRISYIIRDFVLWVEKEKGLIIKRQLKRRRLSITKVDEAGEGNDQAMLNYGGVDFTGIERQGRRWRTDQMPQNRVEIRGLYPVILSHKTIPFFPMN